MALSTRIQSRKTFPNSLDDIYDLPYKILKVAKSQSIAGKKPEEIKALLVT